jgi:hypothetical protein
MADMGLPLTDDDFDLIDSSFPHQVQPLAKSNEITCAFYILTTERASYICNKRNIFAFFSLFSAFSVITDQ